MNSPPPPDRAYHGCLMWRVVRTDTEPVAEVMPGDSALPTGVQAAAAYIRELLLRPGRYRRKWEQYAERSRAGQVNQLAVAEVLAHYLWQNPRAKGESDVLPRQLKDTASRALSGKLLSKATLLLFMDAFGLGDLEREGVHERSEEHTSELQSRFDLVC